jgi:hypothetical protein
MQSPLGFKGLRVIKICSTPSFGGEIKPLAPYHRILWHVKELCEYERAILWTKSIISLA